MNHKQPYQVKGLFQFVSICLLILSKPVVGNELPSDIRLAIDKTPLVEAAEIELRKAQSAAELLRVGNYEFEISATGTDRDIDDATLQNSQFYEWTLMLGRTIRLPSKWKIDKQIAALELDLANARYKSTLFDAQLHFIDLWFEWRKAQVLYGTSHDQLKGMSELVALDVVKVKNGAGRQIDVDRLQAQLHLNELQANQDSALAKNALVVLQMQFPELSEGALGWEFTPSAEDVFRLVNAKLSNLPEVWVADLTYQKSQLQAKRLELDRLPDPSIALGVFDEFDGQETGVIAQFSIPIPGRARQSRMEQATQASNIEALALQRKAIESQQKITLAKQKVTTLELTLKNSQDALNASQSALSKITQGYSKGAVTISELLNMQRVHQQVERACQMQNLEFAKAVLHLALMYDFVLPSNTASSD